tara:strand:- start:3047 stop:3727 length:681 start_codon:yes stop_codon:yes gene_type:complete
MSQINNIIKLIESNNICKITLPDCKEEIEVKRYDIASLNNINNIFTKSDSNEIVLDYYKYLVKLVKNRVNTNLSYLDFLFILLYIRYNENDTYNDNPLKDSIDNVYENINSLELPEQIDFVDGSVKYIVNFELPDFDKIQAVIKICKNNAADVLYYTVFKFVKNVTIEIGEQSTTAEDIQDLKKIYNVISYKALDKINEKVDKITSNLYNLYKVNIETDTGFFLSA